MLDILCIGDAKIDLFLQLPDSDPNFGLDTAKNNLLISYGKKINVETYLKDIGGNASNAAVGISRLGKSVGICAEVGTDEFSNFILNIFRKEAINTSFIIQNPSQPTSFSVCLNYKGERTLLSEHVKRDHNFNFETTSASFIYLTSLGHTWQTAYEKTLSFVTANKSTLVFNPGTLQIADKSKLIMDLISMSEYLFVNKEEAEHLYQNQKDVKKLLFGLKSLGAKNIIITDSSNGSYLHEVENNTYHLDIAKVEVVDKTGAGDAYNAGFISAILNNKSKKDAMIWGAVNSASVVGKIGAEAGLLTKAELEEKINTLTNLKPEII